jgi:hypothetical protein
LFQNAVSSRGTQDAVSILAAGAESVAVVAALFARGIGGRVVRWSSARSGLCHGGGLAGQRSDQGSNEGDSSPALAVVVAGVSHVGSAVLSAGTCVIDVPAAVRGGIDEFNTTVEVAQKYNLAVAASHLVGLRQISEAVYGVDILTLEEVDWAHKTAEAFGRLGGTAAAGAGGVGFLRSRLRVPKAGSFPDVAAPRGTATSPGAGLRARLGAQFDEYMHFRNQGFTPAQAKYLTQPYGNRAGHHFPIPQRVGRGVLLDPIVDSRFNVLKPRGINLGSFYELHYRVDPDFFGAAFPRSIGGSWSGRQLGLEKYTGLERILYATPGPTKVAGGTGIIVVGAGGYWWLSSGNDGE